MARVRVLGDETKLFRSVSSRLEASGFDIVRSVDEKIDLVVYVESHGRDEWVKLQDLLASNPWLPQIYLVKKSHPSFVWINESELSLWLHPTQGQAELVSWAQKLVSVGQLAKQAYSHKPLIDSLSLDVVLDRLVLGLSHQIKCKNIHWVSVERWDDLQKSGDQELEILAQAAQRRGLEWRAAKDQDIDLNFHFLNRLARTTSFTESKNAEGVWIENSLALLLRGGDGCQSLGYFILEGVEEFYDKQMLLRQILQSLRLYQPYLEFALQHWQALSNSYLDDLTELHNQRYLPLVLEQEISRARRQGQSFSVLFMDVDFFKVVNDTRGHWVGSQLLVELGRLLKSCLRSCDYAFRYGGDEFLVVLVSTEAQVAQQVAERIRETIEKARFLIEGNKVQVTISIGLASYPQHAQSKEQLIKMADEAMYYGKNKSRNIVYVAS